MLIRNLSRGCHIPMAQHDGAAIELRNNRPVQTRDVLGLAFAAAPNALISEHLRFGFFRM